MASLSSLRALLPAAHGGASVPVAALKAAATSGASFVVVCPSGSRAKAVVAALQAATKGTGLVLSSRMVACAAAKRSGGGVEDGQGDERTGEDAQAFFVGAREEVIKEDAKAFFAGAGEERTGKAIKRTGEDADEDNSGLVLGTGDNRTGEEISRDDAKAFSVGAGEEANKDDVKAYFVGAGEDRNGKAIKHTKDVVLYGSGEMTMDELVAMFHKETAILLKRVKFFPMDDDDTIANLIASCDAIGDQLGKADTPEGRAVLHRSLIALHLRIVSCCGGVEVLKAGSFMPDMWVGDRHRLPCKANRAGTLMEILLYSMMLARAALASFVSTPPKEIDFRNYD